MDDRKPYLKYLKYSAIGFQVVAVIVIFIWLGSWLDRKIDPTSYTFTLIFTFLGILLSFYSMYKAARDLMK